MIQIRNNKIISSLNVIPKIGFINVISIVLYKMMTVPFIGKKIFRLYTFRINKPFQASENTNSNEIKNKNLVDYANLIMSGEINYFSFHKKKIHNPPDWFHNPFNKTEYADKTKHFTELKDFSFFISNC